MLSLRYPQVHDFIKNKFHRGLFPLRFIEGHTLRLIVKATKEMILAAKKNKQFKVFVVPIQVNELESFALISAFYDNERDPLIITTPLFQEELTEQFKEVLLSGGLDVHFFDESGVEFLGYSTKIECPPAARQMITTLAHSPPSIAVAKNVLEQLDNWFIGRNGVDDANAIVVNLVSSLFPDDFVIIDARPPANLYVSDDLISVNRLERTDPGSFQERDIALLLSRTFPSHQIYLNPMRSDNLKEIVDIMIIGNDRILFIQAKDSPNTEEILGNSINRKKSSAIKHLDKALSQVSGAVRFAVKSDQMNFLIGERKFSVCTSKTRICALVIMKELFLDSYDKYTEMTLAVCNEINKPCIVIEFTELHSYTMYLQNEESFFEAYDKVYEAGKESGVFPRLRFGLSP
jgi:hypothetical protein